jgi:hypothetical protein
MLLVLGMKSNRREMLEGGSHGQDSSSRCTNVEVQDYIFQRNRLPIISKEPVKESARRNSIESTIAISTKQRQLNRGLHV